MNGETQMKQTAPADGEKSTFRKIWNIVSIILVALVVIIAAFLVGARIFGLRIFTVLSGSMEPKYMTGDLIYVKSVDPNTIKEGDDITFVLNEDLVVGTHRVIKVDSDNKRFYTKGINNKIADNDPVLFENLIGKPVFRIPYLGYVSNWIQKPPGLYISIAIAILMILAVFLPDLVNWQAKKILKAQSVPQNGAAGQNESAPVQAPAENDHSEGANEDQQ